MTAADARPRHIAADGRSFLGTSQGPRLSRLHRNVGALLLLRNDGAAGAVHDQAAADPRSCRACPGPWRPSGTFSKSADRCPTRRFASLIYGWYSGLVYFTPVLGGLIADRWLGTRTTVVLGALLMSAGHLAMSFDQSFLLALLMLIVGSGCLKGNISAQVGQLYPKDEETRRTGGFTIFSAAINIGRGAWPARMRCRRCRFRLARGIRRSPLCLCCWRWSSISPANGTFPGSFPRRRGWHVTPGADIARATPGRRVARRRRAHRVAQRCLSNDLEYRAAVDRRTCQPRHSIRTGSRVVVQFHRQLRQHPCRATPGRAVGVAGAAWPRTYGHREDRIGCALTGASAHLSSPPVRRSLAGAVCYGFGPSSVSPVMGIGFMYFWPAAAWRSSPAPRRPRSTRR